MVKPLVVYEQSDYDVGRQVGKALLDGYQVSKRICMVN